jgi:catechol 2,3-dioxygenase-like lactoylglutathione lyase family enzyme
MIDHMTFRVSNLAQTKAFYAAALAPLGYRVAFEMQHEGGGIVGFGYANPSVPGGTKIDTWFVDGPSPYQGHPVSTGAHLCWAAKDRASVDAFYKAAMTQGGIDNGKPGVRPHYHEHYYGAFVIDPEGNNIEACCHYPPP